MSVSAIPEAQLVATGEATIRVSSREMREVAFRALRAAGTCSGEAAAVANLALKAEIHGWGGLAALRQEIDTVPGLAQTAYVDIQDGAFLVDDDMRRGPLLLGVEVFDVAAAWAEQAQRVDVFVRGLRFPQALLCLASELVERVGGTTVLAHLDGAGATTCGAVCTSDGRIRLSARVPAECDSYIPTAARSAATGSHGGLCITHSHCGAAPDVTWPVVSTSDQRERDHAEAISHGSQVQAVDWEAVYRASQRFLIADSPERGQQ